MKIFSENKWNDADELKKFIPVSAGLSFERVQSSLDDACALFLLPLFGESLCERVESIYNATDTPTEEENRLLSEFQRAAANLAFWYNYTELNVRITDMGMSRQETSTEGSFRQTYKYQEDSLRNSFKNKGFNAIDRIIDFLEKNVAAFPEYKEAAACSERRQSIVRDTTEVDSLVFINASHLVFLRLKPYFRQVEETALKPAITPALYDRLKQSLAEGEETIDEARTEDLRSVCANYVIFKSVAKLIRETGSITDRGLYFTSLTAGDGNLVTSPASAEERGTRASVYEEMAGNCHAILMRFIQSNLPAYYTGKQSEVLTRDNDQKCTVWL